MDQYEYNRRVAELLSAQDQGAFPPSDMAVPEMLARPEAAPMSGGGGVPPMLARPEEPQLPLDGGTSKAPTGGVSAPNMSVAPQGQYSIGTTLPEETIVGEPPAPAQQAAPQAPGYSQETRDVSVSVPVEPSVRYGGSPGKLVERSTVGPQAEAAMGASFDAAKQGANDAGDIRQSVGERLREDLQVEKAQLLERQMDSARFAQRWENELQSRQAEIDKDAKEVANQKIDPNRMFAGTDGGFRRIASIAAMALGGFLQGKNGGANPAAEIINRAIDNDLAAQKFAHDSKLKSLDQKKSAFGVAMQRYGNSQAADNMARVYMLDQFRADAEGRLQKAKTEEERAVLREHLGTIDAQREKWKADTLKQMMAGGSQAMRYLPNKGISVTEKQYTDMRLKYDEKALDSSLRIGEKSAEQKGSKDDEARMVDIGDGKFAKMRSTEEAIKYDQERHDIEKYEAQLHATRDAEKKVSGVEKVISPLWKSDDFAALESKQDALVEALARQSGGVVTESDRQGARKRVGDQTAVWNSDAQKEKLKTMQEDINSKKEILDRGRNKTTRQPKSWERNE